MLRIIYSGNILRKKFIGSKEMDILKTLDSCCETAELLALERDAQSKGRNCLDTNRSAQLSVMQAEGQDLLPILWG